MIIGLIMISYLHVSSLAHNKILSVTSKNNGKGNYA